MKVSVAIFALIEVLLWAGMWFVTADGFAHSLWTGLAASMITLSVGAVITLVVWELWKEDA